MFELWIPLYLPIILVVVVGGFWWSVVSARIRALEDRIAALEACCSKTDDLYGWLIDGTATTHSVAHWITLAHDAICNGNTNALCSGAGGGGFNPPTEPPPF